MRALLALAAVALSLYVALTVPVHLGVDLRGGTQLVLETRPTTSDARGKADAGEEVTDRTMEVLRGRIDALGVAEPTIARSGDNRIVVELPGAQNPSKAADMLGRTAELTFHQVLGTAKSPTGEPPTDGTPTNKPSTNGTPAPTRTPTSTPTPLKLPDESGQL
ncbi:MAG: hypothetical protein WCD21_34795, partial [Streptomyces sp.]